MSHNFPGMSLYDQHFTLIRDILYAALPEAFRTVMERLRDLPQRLHDQAAAYFGPSLQRAREYYDYEMATRHFDFDGAWDPTNHNPDAVHPIDLTRLDGRAIVPSYEPGCTREPASLADIIHDCRFRGLGPWDSDAAQKLRLGLKSPDIPFPRVLTPEALIDGLQPNTPAMVEKMTGCSLTSRLPFLRKLRLRQVNNKLRATLFFCEYDILLPGQFEDERSVTTWKYELIIYLNAEKTTYHCQEHETDIGTTRPLCLCVRFVLYRYCHRALYLSTDWKYLRAQFDEDSSELAIQMHNPELFQQVLKMRRKNRKQYAGKIMFILPAEQLPVGPDLSTRPLLGSFPIPVCFDLPMPIDI